MVSDREGLDNDVSSTGAALSTSVAGAMIGAAAGTGWVGAAAGALVSPALMFLRSVVNCARDTQDSRAERAIQITASIVGGLDVMDRWTATDQVRFTLLAEVIEAAARTPLEIKIQALAEVLAEGLQVDGKAHEARVLTAALADIEVPHVALLRLLRDTPLPPGDMRGSAMGSRKPLGWQPPQLKKAMSNLATIMDGLIAVLAGHGLIQSQANDSFGGVAAANEFAITDLGRRCLFLLRFGTDDGEPAAS